MRSIAFIVAVAATPLLLAPAVADGIPGYREEVNPRETIPYRRVEQQVVVPPVVVYPPTVVETPVIVAPPVVVRRPVFIEPPYIVARPRVVFEPRLYAYNPGPPVVRFGPPGRHLGHFRHGY
jgi:hypothetical protein